MVFLSETLPNIRSYTAFIYGYGQPYVLACTVGSVAGTYQLCALLWQKRTILLDTHRQIELICYLQALAFGISVRIHANTHTHTHTHVLTHSHTHTHTLTHTCAHKHRQTHAPACEHLVAARSHKLRAPLVVLAAQHTLSVCVHVCVCVSVCVRVCDLECAFWGEQMDLLHGGSNELGMCLCACVSGL